MNYNSNNNIYIYKYGTGMADFKRWKHVFVCDHTFVFHDIGFDIMIDH